MASASNDRFQRTFASALTHARGEGRVPVIPDIKRRSPKEGDLMRGRDPVDLACQLAEAGAPAISVVTEREHFAGSLELLERIAQRVPVPVLRKDFLRTPADITQSREAGAHSVLLIVANLDDASLRAMHRAAHDEGIETLIEVHTEEELARVADLDLDCLGINNRDILAWERDSGTVARTEGLARRVPTGTVLISESGIYTPDDVRRAAESGATAVLVGTAILQASDPVEQWRTLSISLKGGR